MVYSHTTDITYYQTTALLYKPLNEGKVCVKANVVKIFTVYALYCMLYLENILQYKV